MTMMQHIQRGVRYKPPRFLIYGTEGIGKSTTAASAPKPIFVQTEDGTDQIGCDSFPLAATLSKCWTCWMPWPWMSMTTRRSSSTPSTGWSV